MLSEDFHSNLVSVCLCSSYRIAHFQQHPKTMDAKRVSDNALVLIKRVTTGSTEVSIAEFLTSSEKLGDSRNHVVPILEHFSDEVEQDVTCLVMPLLRPFDDPSFFTVDEITDFMQKTLEVRTRSFGSMRSTLHDAYLCVI